MASFVDHLLKQLDIVEVISKYLTVTKSGKNYKCICPFHEDTNPSLVISPEKQIYKCFVCNEGGNALNFIFNYHRLTNPNFSKLDAIKEACTLANIELPANYQPKNKELNIPPETRKYYEMNDQVSKLYQAYLNSQKGQVAMKYLLEERHLNHKLIQDFQIGYAPKDNVIKEALMKMGYTEVEILENSLLNSYSSDFFKDRIIYPIKNREGYIVGFSGRTLSDNQGPKYLNSSESAIFQKSRLFYNLDKAKTSILKEKKLFIVEGFNDSISLSKAGYEYSIATMGTALTNDHVKILSDFQKFHDVKILYIADGDAAGRRALKENVTYLLNNGLKVSCIDITLPGMNKVDPDWLVINDIDKLTEMINNPKTLTQFIIDRQYIELGLDKAMNPHLIDDYCHQMTKEIAKESKLQQEVMSKYLSQKIGVNEDTIKEMVQSYETPVKDIVLQKESVIPQQSSNDSRITTSKGERNFYKNSKQDILVGQLAVSERIDQKTFNYYTNTLFQDPNALVLSETKQLDKLRTKHKFLSLKGRCVSCNITFMNNSVFAKQNDIQVYQNMIREIKKQIAEQLDIDPSNVDGIFAIHNNTKHRHMHVYVWQKKPIKSRLNIDKSFENKLAVHLKKEQFQIVKIEQQPHNLTLPLKFGV